ncbi:MAG TPA: hypothetical protein VHE61_19950, partial [Opitutaceae bacterium]|nr:hypothetical protein [Opitutaceae bacterium]
GRRPTDSNGSGSDMPRRMLAQFPVTRSNYHRRRATHGYQNRPAKHQMPKTYSGQLDPWPPVGRGACPPSCPP